MSTLNVTREATQDTKGSYYSSRTRKILKIKVIVIESAFHQSPISIEEEKRRKKSFREAYLE